MLFYVVWFVYCLSRIVCFSSLCHWQIMFCVCDSSWASSLLFLLSVFDKVLFCDSAFGSAVALSGPSHIYIISRPGFVVLNNANYSARFDVVLYKVKLKLYSFDMSCIFQVM